MYSDIRPNANVALRLPSGLIKIITVVPNTSISLGKFGTFPTNLIIGRPYHLTFEILGSDEGKKYTELRVVPASEIHAETASIDHDKAQDSTSDQAETGDGTEFDIVAENGEVIMRSNRLTVDDPSRQTLSMEEIEELKKSGTGSGKEIIARIMASHLALDEKTSFSLAKYTLRKSKKYLRRFTVLPLDVNLLAEWILEKEAARILDLRLETLGLISSWANVHYGGASRIFLSEDGAGRIGGGRWIVVEDTGGLLVATFAERMGLLALDEDEVDDEPGPDSVVGDQAQQTITDSAQDTEMQDANGIEPTVTEDAPPEPPKVFRKHVHIPSMSAETNTITHIHSAPQPNLGLLNHFGFDCTAPDDKHPLYTHLKTLTWLQLLHPEEDSGYQEPDAVSESELATYKSSKRGTYYRKRRRWERVKRVADETRAGGYDGLVVASHMDPMNVLKHTIPLLRGGAQVVVYSPSIESLTELHDQFSRDRRSAYIQMVSDPSRDPNEPIDESVFPLNPTLLLGSSLQTARARQYQVLPGRTHPMMTSRGGAEGFVFTATRVLPIEGRVEARGKFTKKKRADVTQPQAESAKKAKVDDSNDS